MKKDNLVTQENLEVMDQTEDKDPEDLMVTKDLKGKKVMKV